MPEENRPTQSPQAFDGSTLIAPQDQVKPVQAPAPADLPRRIPVRLGSYLIEGVIGQGGMGIVYKARQDGLNRVVALKLLLLGEGATSGLRQRFAREARAMAKLRHPNIVSVHEVGEYDGQPFFTMDYVDGMRLDAFLAKSRIESNTICADLLATIADAVHYAHEQGIVHRDLKPGNILMDSKGRPVVTDFGLAKDLDSESMLSITGEIMGTPAFMSPEHAAGRASSVDARTDVYSLGAILYWMLANQTPFSGRTLMETLNRVIHEDAPLVSRVNPDVEPDLAAICLKAMEKDPAARYQSARAMASDLRRFVNGEPVHAAPWSWRRGVGRYARRHKRVLAAAAGVAAMLVLAVIAAALVFGRSYLDVARRQAASSDPAVRVEAVAALGRELLKPDQIAPDDVPEALALMLAAHKDPEARVRKTLLRLLAENGGSATIAGGVRNEVARWLIATADDESDPEQRGMALQAIGAIARPEFTSYLISRLNEPNAALRMSIIRSLGDKRSSEALVPLVNVMVNDPVCRAEAQAALAKLQGSAVPAGDADMEMSRYALGRITAAVAQGAELLEERLEGGRPAARTPMGRYEEALADPNPDVRLKAVYELGNSGEKQAAPLLLAALADPHPDVGAAAAMSLARLDSAGQAHALIERLKAPFAPVRANAALSLGFGRNRSALDQLLVALALEKDPDAKIRIVRALGELGAPEAGPGLAAAADSDPSLGPEVAKALERLPAQPGR